MSKELFVSSTPHETKVAIVEDDQLAEIYFERENEYTLAGSIYKGKVTRVLPGMQSAFVDLGLERDAFLYVTDFLEEQEDVEEFDQVVTQAHETAATGETPGAPAAAERMERAERPERPERPERALPPAEPGNQIERQPISNAATIEDAGGDFVRPDHDGNRDDRGNREDQGGRGGRFRGRRRRGRRGRGGAPEERSAREGAPERAPEAPRSDEQPREPRMDRGDERGNRDDRGNRGNRGDQGPRGEGRDRGGERHDRGGERHDRGGRPDRGGERHDRGGRPDRSGPPAGYQPIVLPGESISKYRNIQPLAGESLSRPPVPEALPGESIARHREPMDTSEVRDDYAPPSPKAQEPREEREAEQRFDQMNVAAVFGGDETTEAEEPSSRGERPSERHEAQPEAAAQGFGAGVVEEEEIEDDESDALEMGDELEGDEFEELEEEELEAENGGEEMIAAGSEVTDAVRDTHVEERATGHFESMNGEGADEEEDDEDGTDFDEVEGAEEGAQDEETMVAEGEAGAESGMEAGEAGAPDRAELRGPAGTAGFQQRSSERTGERGREGERGGDRGRGRFERGRGGRRGRRGRRPGGGGGGGRRNIQGAGRPQIHELLKEGQEILVQIAKEPMGKKGARITSHIALPGRFLVYMPTVAHIGVSRKIGSDEERQRLKRILLSEREETKAHGGFIVRTAAAGASEDDLRADIRFLVNLWNEIKQRAESSKAPSLIYHDLNLVERVLRDQVTQSFGQIWVDNEAEYERVLRFIGRFQPSLVKKVKLYTKEAPLYEAFGIQEEINKALKSKVWLKSGGYIVINQTEALVAIDVNTGKYVGKTGRLEDTIVKTNVDAIKEIVRQIRLRDLGGIIVIDFIDMDERRNRQKVMQALEEALRHDRAPSKVLQFNDFGLVAITRKRVKQSLERTLGQPCTYCTGTGLIKSVTTVCNEIYVEMRKMAKTIDQSDILLRVNPEVAKTLKGSGARWLAEMEELTSRTVIVKGDPTLHQEQFDIQ